MNRPKQKIWVHISPETRMGVLLWEIYEVDIDNQKQLDLVKSRPETYLECADGSYIMLNCAHYFSQKAAELSLEDETATPYFQYIWTGAN